MSIECLSLRNSQQCRNSSNSLKSIYISVPIVESLPRRTFVRRRSTFDDSASFLTPHDNRKAQTETENAMSKNLMSVKCLSAVKRSKGSEFFEFLQKQLCFCFSRRKSPSTYLCTPSVGFRRLGIFFNAPEKSKQRFALSAKALFLMCEYHISYVSGRDLSACACCALLVPSCLSAKQ